MRTAALATVALRADGSTREADLWPTLEGHWRLTDILPKDAQL